MTVCLYVCACVQKRERGSGIERMWRRDREAVGMNVREKYSCVGGCEKSERECVNTVCVCMKEHANLLRTYTGWVYDLKWLNALFNVHNQYIFSG